MAKPWVAIGGALVVIVATHAAPLQRNLADGLVYFRVKALPADLPTDAAMGQHPAVIDVRYAKAEPDAASVFGAWLRFHSSAQRPVFVLANPSTSSAIVSALHETRAAGLLTIGAPGRHFTPDIALDVSGDDEKRAYQALDDGATVASLIADHPAKQRNDEASLTKPAPSTDDAAAPGVSNGNAAPAPEPPIDGALQRAVQLYDGLKAMKTVG